MMQPFRLLRAEMIRLLIRRAAADGLQPKDTGHLPSPQARGPERLTLASYHEGQKAAGFDSLRPERPKGLGMLRSAAVRETEDAG